MTGVNQGAYTSFISRMEICADFPDDGDETFHIELHSPENVVIDARCRSLTVRIGNDGPIPKEWLAGVNLPRVHRQ